MSDKIKQKIYNYLFLTSHYENVGLMRFVLCGSLLYMALFRQLNMDQFNELSLIPRSESLSLYPNFYRPYFESFFWPDSWAAYIHGVYIFLLFFGMIGLSNRFFIFLTWAIAQGFVHRNYSMLYGADLIGTLFLFYLSFTNCNQFFSIKKYFNTSKWIPFKKIFSKWNPEYRSDFFGDQLSSVFFRLMQLQICIIYMYTGFEKLKGQTWWDGTALWTVFANPQFTGFNLIWLKDFPLFFSLGTFITILFEVYFPVMVFNKKTRYYWLFIGLCFHILIGITLSLMTFSLVMLSTYFLFIDHFYLRRWSQILTEK